MICEHCYKTEAVHGNWCQPCLDRYNEGAEKADKNWQQFREAGYLWPHEIGIEPKWIHKDVNNII